jgi:Gluconate 2-dehydrogenase subunit 3
MAMGAASFSGLAASHQISLLKQFEAGKGPSLSASDQKTAASIFQVLLRHMREGMFADPMYGGNHALAGWDLIGYPGVKLVYTAHEQAIGTKLPRAKKTAKSYGGTPFNGPYI